MVAMLLRKSRYFASTPAFFCIISSYFWRGWGWGDVWSNGNRSFDWGEREFWCHLSKTGDQSINSNFYHAYKSDWWIIQRVSDVAGCGLTRTTIDFCFPPKKINVSGVQCLCINAVAACLLFGCCLLRRCLHRFTAGG